MDLTWLVAELIPSLLQKLFALLHLGKELLLAIPMEHPKKEKEIVVEKPGGDINYQPESNKRTKERANLRGLNKWSIPQYCIADIFHHDAIYGYLKCFQGSIST